MPIVVNLRWPGVTKEQYDQALELTTNLSDVESVKVHIASFNEEGVVMTDVWDTEENFNVVLELLRTNVGKYGVAGEPEIEIAEVHRLFVSEID